MKFLITIITVFQLAFNAHAQVFEEKLAAGRWKLEKLIYPKLTFDLSNKEKSLKEFLKARGQFSTSNDSLSDLKTYREMMTSLETVYLALNIDSTFETTLFDEEHAIDKGRYVLNKDKTITFLISNRSTDNIQLEVHLLSKEVLVISAKQEKEDDAPTFSFRKMQ